MNICMVGTGYVGLVTGACLADFGMNVTCVDKDEAKIAALQNGQIPIYEPGLEEIVAKNERAGRLKFSTDLKSAIESSLAIFIAVGTPPRPDGSPDLTFVRQVAEAVAVHMNGYKVVVTKSTVPTGTGKMIEEIVRENDQRHEFSIVSNPEFLREGSAVSDFLRPDRIVIGASDPRAVEVMQEIYSPLYLIETPFVITDVASAELIKYASNGFLAVKISFINEIARLCELMGADVHDVARGWVSTSGSARSSFTPARGSADPAFPRTRPPPRISRGSTDTGSGSSRPRWRSTARRRRGWSRRSSEPRARSRGARGRCSACPSSRRPTTSASPRRSRCSRVSSRRGPGSAPSTRRRSRMRGFSSPDVHYATDAYDCAAGADFLVLATEWNEFRALDLPRLAGAMKSRTIIDLRNVYEPKAMREAGWNYTGVGRG